MIIAIAFIAFAVNSVIFLVTGDWANGIFALAFAIAWGALAIRRGNRKVDRLIQEAAPRPGARRQLRFTGYGEDGREFVTVQDDPGEEKS